MLYNIGLFSNLEFKYIVNAFIIIARVPSMTETSIGRVQDYVFSSSSLQSSSSRSIFHVGRPAIYISPKLVSDLAVPQDQQNSAQHCVSVNVNANVSKQQISLKLAMHLDQGQSQKIQHQYDDNDEKDEKNVKQGSVNHYNGLALWIAQALIMIVFLICSLDTKQYSTLSYVDLSINMLLILKMLLLHIYLFNHNRTLKPASLTSPSPSPSTLYSNTLQLYQILQLWSFVTTVFLNILSQQEHTIWYTVAQGLRMPRLLFFIILVKERSSNIVNIGAILTNLKVIAIIALISIIAVISLQMLLYNIDNYYCLSTNTLTQLTIMNTNDTSDINLISCGINKPCQSTVQNDVQCRNIYSLVNNQAHIDNINTVLNQFNTQIKSNIGFSDSFAVSVTTLVTHSAQLYAIYQAFIPQVIILPITVFVWILYVIVLGIGIGQSLRHHHISTFRSLLLSKKQFALQNPQNSSIQSQQQKQQNIFTQISEQLNSRPLLAKLLTILFNSIYLLQVILIIIYNMHKQQSSIKQWTGIGLGVVFILWVFGYALAVFQYCGSTHDNDDGQSNRRNILIYQGTALGLAFCDYILRIIQSQLLFQSSTVITPFSHAIISLRILFILYNNGFDAHISVYVQKIMTASLLCLRQVGTVMIIGVIIGLVQALTTTQQNVEIRDRVIFVAKAIATVLGLSVQLFNNQGIEIRNDGEVSKIIQAILPFVALLCTFYLMKNIILTYSRILPIDLSEQKDQNLSIKDDNKIIDNKQQYQHSVAQQSPLISSACPSPSPHPLTFTQSPPLPLIATQPSTCPSTPPCTKQHPSLMHRLCITILDSQYYTKFKILTIIIYVVLSLFYQNINQAVDIVKFVIDILLTLDLIVHFVVYGICGYFQHYTSIKSAYVISQIYLIISFFIIHICPISLTSSLHLSRILLLFDYVQALRKQIQIIFKILLHYNTKIYKILLIMLSCVIIGIVLVTDQSNNISNTGANNNNVNYGNYDQWSQIMQAVALMFGYGYHTSINMGLQFVAVDIVYALVIIFVHGLFLYMILVHIHHQQSTSQPQQFPQSLLHQYSSSTPSIYSHRPSNYPYISNYLKFLKILLIITTLLLLSFLSGQYLQISQWRSFIAGANLIINFIEFWIYVIQGWIYQYKWGKMQGIAIGVGIIGSAFLVFPVLKFQSYLQLSIVIRMFLFLSVLRTLRIFPLLNSHYCSLLSSYLIRRISSYIFPMSTRIISLIFLLLSSLLPISLFLTLISQQSTLKQLKFIDPFPQLLNLLSGRSLLTYTPIDNSQFINTLSCVIRLFAVCFVVFPIKMIIIAEIITMINCQFMEKNTNKYVKNALMETVKLQINQAIVNSGLLDRQKQQLYVPLSSIYKFNAQISRIFTQISHKKHIKCQPYAQILEQLKDMRINVFIFTRTNEQGQKFTEYGIFVYDIIHHYFNKTINKLINKGNYENEKNVGSLYCLGKIKKQNVTKSHFTVNQYYSFLRIKDKLFKKMRRFRKQLLKQQCKIAQPLKSDRSSTCK